MYACMYVCMYVCIYPCMYVCMYVHLRPCVHKSTAPSLTNSPSQGIPAALIATLSVARDENCLRSENEEHVIPHELTISTAA